jgi:hypothetical protein
MILINKLTLDEFVRDLLLAYEEISSCLENTKDRSVLGVGLPLTIIKEISSCCNHGNVTSVRVNDHRDNTIYASSGSLAKPLYHDDR